MIHTFFVWIILLYEWIHTKYVWIIHMYDFQHTYFVWIIHMYERSIFCMPKFFFLNRDSYICMNHTYCVWFIHMYESYIFCMIHTKICMIHTKICMIHTSVCMIHTKCMIWRCCRYILAKKSLFNVYFNKISFFKNIFRILTIKILPLINLTLLNTILKK